MSNSENIKNQETGFRIKLHLRKKIELLNLSPNYLCQELYRRGVIADKYALELLKGMEKDEHERYLSFITPHNLGFKPDFSIGEFYTKARTTNRYLPCAISDALRFAIEDDQELGEEKIVLGMLPRMCQSDKKKRTFLFEQDDHGLLHMKGFVWPEGRFYTERKVLFRIPIKQTHNPQI